MQASVKQVQFLEVLEERCGVPYTGKRWDMEEVSAYLSANSKPKEQKQSQQYKRQESKGSYNKYNNNYGDKKPKFNKITDKQRQYIKVLENKTGVFFSGKTFEEAEEYIKANRSNS